MRRPATYLAVVIAALASLLTPFAAPASAATGPNIYTQCPGCYAGYLASGALFRYIAMTMVVRDEGNIEEEIALEPYRFPSTVVNELGIFKVPGNHPYGILCAVPLTPGPGPISTRDTLQFAIYYDPATRYMYFTVTDLTAKWTARAKEQFTTPVKLGHALIVVNDSNNLSTAPPSTFITRLSKISLTTYNGHRSGLASWWKARKVEGTANGMASGAPELVPSAPANKNTSFTVVASPLN